MFEDTKGVIKSVYQGRTDKQWPKDTKGVIKSVYQGRTDKQWPKDTKGVIKSVYQGRTDKAMAKRYQRGNQVRISRKNRQSNGQKIPKG